MAKFEPRSRKVKILATVGPASRTPDMLRRLFRAGADAFRINLSHGEHKDHAKVIKTIRALEKEFNATCRAPSCGSAASKAARQSSRMATSSRSTAIRRPATRSASACRIPSCSRCSRSASGC
jgi:hypothetical protein